SCEVRTAMRRSLTSARAQAGIDTEVTNRRVAQTKSTLQEGRMDGQTASAVDVGSSEDARLESLGYKPQLNRVLGAFSNFAVAFTYLSPMVGIYSLFILGVGRGGPAYIWLTIIPVIGMLFVALVFGELASHYPVAGALFQYSKFNVGAGYGWFVG